MSLGRPSPSTLVAHLEGQAVLLHLVSRDYFRLNETATVIWRAIERGEERDAVISALVAEFDVNGDEAGAALDALVTELHRRELIVSP